ncbi:MAG: hypothetical protein SF029_18880 [bacterium]|nr:hypothetical protein [bacterium]
MEIDENIGLEAKLQVMADINQIISDLGFPKQLYEVKDRRSIAHVIRLKRLYGIYVLHFANGEFYAGLTINVVRRFAQHVVNHKDIVALSFKQVSLNKLQSEEKRVIQTLEKAGFHLRNIIHTSISYAPSAFDEVMPPQQQEQWVNDVNFVISTGQRADEPELRRKYKDRYAKLVQKPYAEEMIQVIRQYVQTCIPTYLSSEMYYWNVSCLLEKRANNMLIYSRVCIYWQEVFTVGTINGEPFFSWHLARSPLEINVKLKRGTLTTLNPALFLKHPLHAHLHTYKPGGQDQINLQLDGSIEAALNVLHEPTILYAIRRFNLNLMRKGLNIYYKYHCFDLADRLVN